ncbi:hypothetical protein Tco_1182579 [Tanacetum coccineum]
MGFLRSLMSDGETPNLRREISEICQTTRASLVGALSLSTILTKIGCHENYLFPVKTGRANKSMPHMSKDFTNLDGDVDLAARVSRLLCINNFEVKFLEEENPSEQSRLGILFCKEILKGGMVRMHYAFVHDEKFDFTTIKAASTPIETNKALNKDEEAEDVDVHLYRSMIGSLMYLTASRPDIMFVVCACARFQVTPKTSHLHAVKRIFRYLKGQSKLGLWYPMDSPFDLEAFSGSNYARASLDKKSTTGAEYVAAANCCGQVLWIQNQMLDYGFNFMNTKIHIDNEITICILKNPVFHSKTKHIEIRHHFIRDSYEKKLVQVMKIHTDHNVADLLTKAFDVNETVYKEWEDIMERAATTASSLEAEQDSGNINRTQSMATLNESFPQGTDSGSGPRIGVDTARHKLNTVSIKYTLTESPTIYVSLIEQFWQTASASTLENRDKEITATIDGKVKVVSEASIRRHLKLEDFDGISTLPTS